MLTASPLSPRLFPDHLPRQPSSPPPRPPSPHQSEATRAVTDPRFQFGYSDIKVCLTLLESSHLLTPSFPNSCPNISPRRIRSALLLRVIAVFVAGILRSKRPLIMNAAMGFVKTTDARMRFESLNSLHDKSEMHIEAIMK